MENHLRLRSKMLLELWFSAKWLSICVLPVQLGIIGSKCTASVLNADIGLFIVSFHSGQLTHFWFSAHLICWFGCCGWLCFDTTITLIVPDFLEQVFSRHGFVVFYNFLDHFFSIIFLNFESGVSETWFLGALFKFLQNERNQRRTLFSYVRSSALLSY